MRYDVAIVGAGPSGASTAKHCAEKGLKVIIIEKKVQPGYPSHCAGYIPKLVSRYFRIPRACIQQKIKKMATFFPSGKIKFTSMHGFIVDRSLFDKFLCLQALDAGAKIVVGGSVIALKEKTLKVMVKNKKIDIKADFIVGADGALSKVARWMGFNRPNLIKCAQYEVHNITGIEEETAETYFDLNLTKAYAWIYPCGNSSAKVGIGTINENPVKKLNLFMKMVPKLRNTNIYSIYSGFIPIRKSLALGKKHVLLVGDAAGVTDAISGAGILSGIISGKAASKAIAMNDIEVYHKSIKKILGKRLKRALLKREKLNRLKSNSELEKELPKLWIAFKDYWRNEK